MSRCATQGATWVGRRAVVAWLAASGVAACDAPGAGRAGFKSVDLTGAEYARGFELPDASGRVRRLQDFAGKVTIVFFGYTQCPDVCPTTLAEIAEARRLLGADGARVQPVFVTVDPERDTPDLLSAYVANFGPDIVALRGTPEQVRATAAEFKVFFAKSPGKTEGSYTVDHTAASFVFDAKGRVRLYARYGIGAEALAQDLRQLLASVS